MKRDYSRTIKELHLDDAIENYKYYMMGGFIAIEYGATQLIGIDLGGFTRQQGMMMHKYDKLLIELGEKSYNSWGSSLPAELRILGMILLQAGIFYLGKILTAKFGGTIGELFSGFMGQPPDLTDKPSEPQQKRKMRGPKTRVEDLKKMREDM